MLTLFKSLADQTRLRLVAILQYGEFTVQELVEILSMGQSRVSRHLKILLDANVLQVKREGTWAYYQLQPSDELFTALQPLLANHWTGLAGHTQDCTALTATLAKRRQRSREFFDRHARQWDQMAQDLLPTPDYQAQLFALLPHCANLLEVGVGTGRMLETLQQKATMVIGVDHSLPMLDAAKEMVATKRLTGIELKLGQMEGLPLESASVDVALIHMVLHHAPEPLVALAEIKRVLRPGGLLVVSDLLHHTQEWVREKLADQWLGFSLEQLSNWCHDAGYQSINSHTVSGRGAELPVVLLTAQNSN